MVQVLLASPVAKLGPGRSILRPRGRRIKATLVGRDDETDLALLKIERRALPALPLADPDLLRPGQIVIAFGSPLGLRNSASLGVISATARQLRSDDPMIYIQTENASINPGSSGGPLLNTAGEVVGINTLIFSQSGGSEGIGFSTPSNIVRHVFDEIRSNGRVRRGQLGIQVQTARPSRRTGTGSIVGRHHLRCPPWKSGHALQSQNRRCHPDAGRKGNGEWTPVRSQHLSESSG